jgi:hypothetical protein
MSASSSADAIIEVAVDRHRQSIERADGGTYREVGNVEISGRGLQVTMPHQNLDAAQIGRRFEQMSGEAVPQGMG